MSIVSLFCKIDDFFLAYEAYLALRTLEAGKPAETRRRPQSLHPSEVMTILIAFHQSGYRTFKYGDNGYISKDLREMLNAEGIHLVYKVRKNMNPLELSVSDEVLLKKRSIIESVIKELKTQTVLEHSRHRSFVNFRVNVVSALIAYQLLESKPSVKFSELQGNTDLPVTS